MLLLLVYCIVSLSNLHVLVFLVTSPLVFLEDLHGHKLFVVLSQCIFIVPYCNRNKVLFYSNLHCDIHVAAVNKRTLQPFDSLDSFWITRSKRSRRRDKKNDGLYSNSKTIQRTQIRIV